MTILIALAVLPAIYLLITVYKQDKIEKEPSSLIINLFIFGGIAAFLAGTLEEYGQALLNLFSIQNEKIYTVIFAFMVIGVIEEGLKFIFLKKITWKHPAFNYRFDAILYAISVSLGFAALENILYVFSYGLSVVIPRALLAIPAHTGFAVFMGAYYGRAKLAFDRGHKSKSVFLQFLGYLSAVFLHGFYDACAMINEPLYTNIFMGFVVIMYIIVIRKIRKESKTDAAV
jgi:RsiW-degrading membrane proteinase PrsW (M82 family)